MARFFYFLFSKLNILYIGFLKQNQIMKNSIYLVTFLFCLTSFAQKKKATTSKLPTSFAKTENLNLEIKNKTFQISISEKGKTIDALPIKEVDASFMPLNSKLISFTASGTKLYLLSWEEKSNTKTPTKTEDATTLNSKVFDITDKKELFTNSKTTTKITEQVFLDKNKTASETQEKMRNEGYDFVLNPDGSITQKSKKTEIKWIYDAAKKEYLDSKKKK